MDNSNRLKPESLVGEGGLEPPTSRSQSAHSSQLSYSPIKTLIIPKKGEIAYNFRKFRFFE